MIFSRIFLVASILNNLLWESLWPGSRQHAASCPGTPYPPSLSLLHWCRRSKCLTIISIFNPMTRWSRGSLATTTSIPPSRSHSSSCFSLLMSLRFIEISKWKACQFNIDFEGRRSDNLVRCCKNLLLRSWPPMENIWALWTKMNNDRLALFQNFYCDYCLIIIVGRWVGPTDGAQRGVAHCRCGLQSHPPSILLHCQAQVPNDPDNDDDKKDVRSCFQPSTLMGIDRQNYRLG